MPAFCSAAKVPPVESKVIWRAASARANSTKPDLSETDRSARRMGMNGPRYPLALLPSIDSIALPPERVGTDLRGAKWRVWRVALLRQPLKCCIENVGYYQGLCVDELRPPVVLALPEPAGSRRLGELQLDPRQRRFRALPTRRAAAGRRRRVAQGNHRLCGARPSRERRQEGAGLRARPAPVPRLHSPGRRRGLLRVRQDQHRRVPRIVSIVRQLRSV